MFILMDNNISLSFRIFNRSYECHLSHSSLFAGF